MWIDGNHLTGIGLQLIHSVNHVLNGFGHMQVIILHMQPEVSGMFFNQVIYCVTSESGTSTSLRHWDKLCGKFAFGQYGLDVGDYRIIAMIVQNEQLDLMVLHLIDAVHQAANAGVDDLGLGPVNVSGSVNGKNSATCSGYDC
jgi:hypothetical protein